MSLRFDGSPLAKGWKRYFVMHKNRRVATVREDGTCTVYYRSFLPYNLYLEESGDMDARLNNLNNFYYWCASRVLTLDRKYAKEILNAIGARQVVTDRDRANIALSYHAVCLTDVYWVCGEGERLRFEDISLYRYSLSDAFADVALAGRQITAQNAELMVNRDVAGDVSTSGIAPKAWIREDGTFYLMKDGSERDVRAELLASQIADCFACPHVRYTESTFDGKTVTKSKLITDEDFSIAAMEYVDIYCVNRGTERERFVLRRDARSFYMMNIIDYLVGNTDRHWGNWGFTVDNAANKLCGLYPLMDFNKAFTAYDTAEGGKCLTVSRNMTQREAAVQAVREIGLNRIADISPALFHDRPTCEMFFARLRILEEA